MLQRRFRVAGLAALREEVAELVEADRNVARRFRRVGVAGEKILAELQLAVVVLQRRFGVARLAASREEVAELFEADRNVARGLRRVGVAGEEIVGELQPAFVVLQRRFGVAGLAALREEVAELVEADRDVARGLPRVGVAGE